MVRVPAGQDTFAFSLSGWEEGLEEPLLTGQGEGYSCKPLGKDGLQGQVNGIAEEVAALAHA